MDETRHNYSNVLLEDDFTTAYPDNLSVIPDNTMFYSLISNSTPGSGYLLSDNVTSFKNDTFIGNWEFVGSQEYYIALYTIFIIASMVLTPARSLLFYRIFMNASKGLHKKMFANVLAAPMRFFDTNPSGMSLYLL